MVSTRVQIYKPFTRIISVFDSFFPFFPLLFLLPNIPTTAKNILEGYMANNGMTSASTISKRQHIIVTLEYQNNK